MKKKSNLKTNVILSLLTTLITGLTTTIYPVFIGILYSTTVMGQFAILYSWVIFLSIPIANGIAPAIMRFIAASTEESTKGLEELGFQFSLIYFFSVFLCLIPLNIVFFKFNSTKILVMLILLFMVDSHFIFKKSLQGKELFKKLFNVEAISFIIFIIGSFFFLFFSNMDDSTSGWYLLIPMLIYHFVFNSLYVITKVRKFDFSVLEFKIFGYESKRILKYSIFIGVGSLFGLGISQIQIIISDLYFTDYEVGVLGFWKYVVAMFSFLPLALSSLLVVRITNLKRIKSELAFDFVNSINWSLSMIVVPILGFLILLSSFYPNILDILTFSKYQMTKYWPIFALLLFQAINSILATPTLCYTHSSEKYVKIDSLNSIIYSFITIMSWIIFVPLFHIFGFATGIAAGSLFSQIILQISVIKITNKAIGSHLYLLLPMYFLLGSILTFNGKILPNVAIILWSLFCLPFFLIGLHKMRSFIGEKSFIVKQ